MCLSCVTGQSTARIEFWKVTFYRGTKTIVEAGFVSHNEARQYADRMVQRHGGRSVVSNYFETR
jgi:hypothetical protein